MAEKDYLCAEMTKFADNFTERTRDYIAGGRLLHEGAPVVVALSGGADSVALLSVLAALGYECHAAHCNFHLRGEESMRDMRHCRDICARLDTNLLIRDFDVAAYRREHGGSVEMACRDLRYRWFEDLLDKLGAQAVAVGHHREDRAETFMLNLMRGAGLAGLTSMRPRSGNVVRPLLPFSREEIERYLADMGLGFITDSSNASDAHRRNRLRNHIIPALEEAFPGAVDSILRTVANLESAAVLCRTAAEAAAKEYVATEQGVTTVDISRLALREDAAEILRHILEGRGFTATQIADMLASADSSGQRFLPVAGACVAELSRGKLYITAVGDAIADEDTYPVDIRHDITSPVTIEVSVHPVEKFPSETFGADAAFIDAAVLGKNMRWELRHPRRGDRMVPFGSRSSKLLSDIFNNARLTAPQKRQTWVLTCDGAIVWLPGLRNSALYTVGPGTKRYIRLHLTR